MNIQYSKKKQEMRRDPFIDSLVGAKRYVTARRQPLTVSAAIVLVLALGFVLFSQMRGASLRRADEAFGKALLVYTSGSPDGAIEELSIVANEHKGTPHATYCAFMMGALLLQQERYEEAMAWFEDASRGSGRTGFVSAAALEGLSSACVGMGDYEQAMAFGREALGDERLAFRHPALRWKLALVSREMSDTDGAARLCGELVSDTLAVAYHQKARNMLAVLESKGGS